MDAIRARHWKIVEYALKRSEEFSLYKIYGRQRA